MNRDLAVSAEPNERLIDKIGKLIAQAEGTDNEHEAAAFIERAQVLATSNAIDLERARARQRERQQRGGAEPLEQVKVLIGERGRRGNRHKVLLYCIVGGCNDVMVNVANDSTFVLGFGYRADLHVVEQLWTSLALQMATAAQRRLDAGGHIEAGVTAITWRLSFYDGWLKTVQQRLQEARDRAIASVSPEAGETSAALVLRDKGDRVKDFHGKESTARGSWRGAAAGRSGVSRSAAREGAVEGARANLGQAPLGVRQQIA